VIDFSKLKTIEEKLIVLYLAQPEAKHHLKGIFQTLAVTEQGCRKTLKALLAKGLLNCKTNQYEILEYGISENETELRNPKQSFGGTHFSGTTLTLVNQTERNLTNKNLKIEKTSASA
jgi:hypothetical protein